MKRMGQSSQGWYKIATPTLPPSLPPSFPHSLTTGLMQASESDSELDLPTGNAEIIDDDFDFYS